MLAVYAVNFFILLMLFVPSDGQQQPQQNVKLISESLWCVEGEKKVFSPVQCPPETTECFKFNCDGIEEPFVARGCGLSVLTSAAGLPNESCHQAQSICEYIGGRSSCFTCNNKHMCNSTNFPNFSVVIISVLSLVIIPMVFSGFIY